MSADILLYAIIAAGLVFWLKSILGTEDDEEAQNRELNHEKRQRQSDEAGEESFLAPIKKSNDLNDNIVRLNNLTGNKMDLPRHIFFDNKTAENNLDDIMIAKPDFDFGHFLEGAEYAFPMIIEAFAEGDLETLKDLLDDGVYQGFENAIKSREEKGEEVTTHVKSIDRIDIVEVFTKNDIFFITLRFHANEICIIKDKDGKVIANEEGKPTKMVDVWVFGQPEDADGPEWYLYETRDDEEEEHKTPVPDAGDTK